MSSVMQQRLRLSGGTELSFVTAGDPSRPALLLLHGFPNSARMFQNVIRGLADVAFVIAPDLPGYGRSAPLPVASFAAFGAAITELLDHLGTEQRFIYLHDWGAAVGLQIAMQSPEVVSGLVIQNANAHRSGLGPLWKPVFEYWSKPNPENEAAAHAYLTFEGIRAHYIEGVPEDVAAKIKGEPWVADWGRAVFARTDGNGTSAYRRLFKPRGQF
jgi:pimeloyl-ACP methyl ester carboxylesterase